MATAQAHITNPVTVVTMYVAAVLGRTAYRTSPTTKKAPTSHQFTCFPFPERTTWLITMSRKAHAFVLRGVRKIPPSRRPSMIFSRAGCVRPDAEKTGWA